MAKNGNNRISSTSKIRKILANKKNRKLKGIKPRSEVMKPHSKGLINSEFSIDFFLRTRPTKKINSLKIKAQKKISKFKKISLKF